MNKTTIEWENKGTFSYNGINGTSYSISNDNCFIDDHFDVGIFFSSFESRSLFSSNHLIRESCTFSLVVLFNEASESDLRKKHDKAILDQVNHCSKNTPLSLRNISIKDLKDTLLRLINAIPKEYYNDKAKWFIDLGGAPTPYFLGLIGFLKNLSLPPEVTLFNPTGDYDIKSENQVLHFTSGFVKNIYIPNFWGTRDVALPRKYVFMLGHDEYRSYKIYEQQEPDEIDVFITSPGYRPEYEKIAYERHKNFFNECGISDRKINRSCAANISETINKLREIISPCKNEKNICLVPLGVKAHALSCGICSLAEVFPSVLYNMPRSYKIKDTKAGNTIWKYEINF